MAGRKQTLEELLRDVDRHQRRRAHKPQAGQRERVTRQRPLTGQRTPQQPQEPTDRRRQQQHDPRNDRMQSRSGPDAEAQCPRDHRRPARTATRAPAAPRPASTPHGQAHESQPGDHRARTSSREDNPFTLHAPPIQPHQRTRNAPPRAPPADRHQRSTHPRRTLLWLTGMLILLVGVAIRIAGHGTAGGDLLILGALALIRPQPDQHRETLASNPAPAPAPSPHRTQSTQGIRPRRPRVHCRGTPATVARERAGSLESGGGAGGARRAASAVVAGAGGRVLRVGVGALQLLVV